MAKALAALALDPQHHAIHIVPLQRNCIAASPVRRRHSSSENTQPGVERWHVLRIVGKGFDPLDQLKRYQRWYREGYLSSIAEQRNLYDGPF